MGIKIATERLTLRELEATDFDIIHEYATDPDVLRFMTWGPNTPEETKSFIETHLDPLKHPERNEIVLAITVNENMIGTIGMTFKDEGVELGYVTSKKYWGNGYVTEAAHATMQYFKSKFAVKVFTVRCASDNHGSQRVIEKCGFTFIKTLPKEKTGDGNAHEILYFEKRV